MGISTWSMHYTGMLAFRLPIPMEYDWPTAFLSYLTSFCTSALGLFVVSRRKMGFVRAFTASIFMGGGVAAMHYTAMASMRLRAVCHYSPALVTISVVLAIVFSLMSLWLTFLFREEALGQFLRKVASAVLLGAAIAVMHYTGMASASFIPCAEFPDLSHALPISALSIPGIAVVNLMIVVVVLLTSLADRLQKQKALLDELFEQAPQAVALMGVDHRILRVNQEFSRVFGYSSQEALGQRISELIAGEEGREEEQKYADFVAQGRRVDAEGVRRRKDGSSLYVSMVRVPVRLPNRQVAIYAIYRDISEHKQAEAALRQTNERLQKLSRRLFQVQEDERRHLARELHDQMGQALTAAKLNLQAAQRLEEWSLIARKLDDGIAALETLLQQARQISLDLRPPLLDDLGLVPALRWYLDQQAQRAGLRIEFFADPALERMSPEIETACFRVAQEGLTNVVRHARAQTVSVELRRTPEALHLVVRDDGIGFDVMTAEQQGVSLGLLGMRERATLLGGEMDCKSAPGRGTEIHAFFPVRTRADTQEPRL
jgi:PAS domain S-box-containing protein